MKKIVSESLYEFRQNSLQINEGFLSALAKEQKDLIFQYAQKEELSDEDIEKLKQPVKTKILGLNVGSVIDTVLSLTDYTALTYNKKDIEQNKKLILMLLKKIAKDLEIKKNCFIKVTSNMELQDNRCKVSTK